MRLSSTTTTCPQGDLGVGVAAGVDTPSKGVTFHLGTGTSLVPLNAAQGERTMITTTTTPPLLNLITWIGLDGEELDEPNSSEIFQLQEGESLTTHIIWALAKLGIRDAQVTNPLPVRATYEGDPTDGSCDFEIRDISDEVTSDTYRIFVGYEAWVPAS